MPVKPFVRLDHAVFRDPVSYFDRLTQTCQEADADFVDGTAFSPDEIYLTTGTFCESAPFVSNYTHKQIYYKSIQHITADYLSVKDYIWRWDTDWFWCSKQFHLQHPLVRLLATRYLLNSRTYQRIMRLSHRFMPSSNGTESVIQDVDIPIENAPEFFEFLFREIRIAPVWICPFRASGHPGPLYALTAGKLYVNFGFWDIIASDREPGHYNRKIEDKCLELQGKKALYSSSYYTQETFWSIYGKPCYDALKQKYDPAGVFPGLYEKCVYRH
jgi:FAD/FMN-containing dehydrogenase